MLTTQPTAIAVVNVDAIRRENDGLVVTKSAKTGAGALSIKRKKVFMNEWLALRENAQKKRSEAARAFNAYRLEHAAAFNERVIEQMQAKKLLVHRASISKTGAIRGVSFMLPRDAQAVRLNEAQVKLANESGISLEVLEKAIALGKRKAKDEEDATIDVQTSEVPASAPAEAMAASA